jgi:flagellar basal-body rod modification protein FlgD
MDFDLKLNSTDMLRTQFQVDAFNKSLNAGNAPKAELDKDDFLKILVTQLQHQDPTNPMQDREFIAQMAQFSSLEQMTNMSKNFVKLAGVLSSSEAQALLGKNVEVMDGDRAIYGPVTQVVRGDFPLVMVNGAFYDLAQVGKVMEE